MDMEIKRQLERLNQCVKAIDAVYHSAAVRFGLSDSVFWILLVLSESDRPYTQQELCGEWFYSKQTVNSAIQKLLREGHVHLEPVPSSRNSKLVFLTESGWQLAEDTVLRLSKADYAAFSRMNEEERSAFLALHESITHCFRQKWNSFDISI